MPDGRSRGAVRATRQVLAIAVVLAAWQIIPTVGLTQSVFFPPLSDVLASFVAMITDGTLLREAAVTIVRTLIAVALGLVCGVVVGLAMDASHPARWLLDPLVAVGYPMPKIALVPIFVLWFGIGDLSKILLAALTTFFPVVISTYAAAQGVKLRLRWSAQALGAGRLRMFTRIVLPATLPGVMSGLQVALPLATIVVVVAEMTSSGGGLGNLLTVASRTFQVAAQFSVLFSLMVIGLVFDRGLISLRRRMLPWE